MPRLGSKMPRRGKGSQQQKYKSVAVIPDTWDKIRYWAGARGWTMGEAVDYAFDMLGPPDDEDLQIGGK